MKKVYVAGKFEQKDEVIKIQKQLINSGYKISYDWTTHVGIKPYEQNQDQARLYSENEINAIAESDIFIYLTQEYGTTNKMEFGAAVMKKALGNDIQIFAMGEFNNKSPWYFNSYVERVNSIEEVYKNLGL